MTSQEFIARRGLILTRGVNKRPLSLTIVPLGPDRSAHLVAEFDCAFIQPRTGAVHTPPFMLNTNELFGELQEHALVLALAISTTNYPGSSLGHKIGSH